MLTEKQHHTFKFIKDYVKEFGYAPTTFSYGDSSVYPASTAGTTVDETLEFHSSSTNNRFHWREYVNGVHTYSQNVEGLNIGKIHMVVSYENGTVKHYINNNLVYTATSTLPAQDFHWILNKSLDVDSFTDRDIYFFR